jgi:hypothetical protein
VANFFSRFTEYSHFRSTAVKAVLSSFENETDADVQAHLAQLVSVSGWPYIVSCFSIPERAPELFTQHQPIGVERPRSIAIKTEMADFICEQFDNTPSGSTHPRLQVRGSFWQGYCGYPGPGSFGTFLKLCHQVSLCCCCSEVNVVIAACHCGCSDRGG